MKKPVKKIPLDFCTVGKHVLERSLVFTIFVCFLLLCCDKDLSGC